jgi:hypothetical protein
LVKSVEGQRFIFPGLSEFAQFQAEELKKKKNQQNEIERVQHVFCILTHVLCVVVNQCPVQGTCGVTKTMHKTTGASFVISFVGECTCKIQARYISTSVIVILQRVFLQSIQYWSHLFEKKKTEKPD